MLALLKHDEPEAQLRSGLERQLTEFLESGTYFATVCLDVVIDIMFIFRL